MTSRRTVGSCIVNKEQTNELLEIATNKESFKISIQALGYFAIDKQLYVASTALQIHTCKSLVVTKFPTTRQQFQDEEKREIIP